MITTNQTVLTDVTPEAAGYRPEILIRLNELLAGLVRDRRLQCASYMLARDGKVFAAAALGKLRHTEGVEELKVDSIRRIASITKWFTLVAVMQLVEEGKLHLRQPVKTWIPEFDKPPFDKITVYHLLTHTSGLVADGGYFLEPYPLPWWETQFAHEVDEAPKKQRTPEEEREFRRSVLVKSLLAANPVCEPGKAWCYSSAGYTVLGALVGLLRGTTYEEAVRRRIIEPLQLERTFFDVPEELTSEVCTTIDWDEQRLNHQRGDDPLDPRSGGGLYSTLADLTRFGQVMMTGAWNGKRIISRKSLELIARDQFPAGIPAYSWGADFKEYHTGLGANLPDTGETTGPGAYWHEGAGRSYLIVDPAERFSAAVFVPTNSDWVPESVISVRNMIWSGLR